MNAVLAYIDMGDRHVCGRLAHWNPPQWFRAWMVAATHLGDGWLWAFVAFGLLAAGDYGVFATAALSSSAANALMIVLKKKCRRRRPSLAGTNHFFQLMKADLSAFDNFSFPSGHTMNAFAIGTVLASSHPQLLPITFLVALNVAASRIVLRMHYLTDVLVGAALGSIIGGLVCQVLG